MAQVRTNQQEAIPMQFRSDRGFTLLEVLVALAIVGPALALLFSQGVASVTTTRTAARYEEAISRARSRLATLSDRNLIAGERSGDDGSGFRWRTRIAQLATTTPTPDAARAGAYARGVALYDITVEISWPGVTSDRSMALATRRLGPAATVAP
jgi:general secretion pathway protein I